MEESVLPGAEEAEERGWEFGQERTSSRMKTTSCRGAGDEQAEKHMIRGERELPRPGRKLSSSREPSGEPAPTSSSPRVS